MYCIKCGKEIPEDSKFCVSCGSNLEVNYKNNEFEENLILPATLLRRFINLIIDSVAVVVFSFALVIFSSILFSEFITGILSIFSFIIYYLIFEFFFQKTLGKVFTGTKVVNLNGEKPNFLSILGRTLSRYIPFEALSFLFYGNYPTKGWHDRLSNTLVVPKDLTPEQVKSINPEEIKKQKTDNVAGVIVVIVVGSFFFLAIIGILSSVVLASLNSAREQGEDASAKANLSNLRAQAEIYYMDNNDSYSDFCDSSEVKKLLDENINYVCNDSYSEYSISAPLNKGDYFCVDNIDSKTIENRIWTQTSCSKTSSKNSNFDYQRDEGKTFSQLLKEDVDFFNSNFDLPEMVDEDIRLDNVYVSDGDTMAYDFTVFNILSEETNQNTFEEVISSELVVDFCNSSEFNYIREGEGAIRWNYYDTNKNLIGSVELSDNDCI